MTLSVALVRHADFRMDTYDIIENGAGYVLVPQLPKILENLEYQVFSKIYTLTSKDDSKKNKRVIQTAQLCNLDVCTDFNYDMYADNITDLTGIIEEVIKGNNGVESSKENLCAIIVTHQENIEKLADITSVFVENSEEFFLATTSNGQSNIPFGSAFIIKVNDFDISLNNGNSQILYEGKIFEDKGFINIEQVDKELIQVSFDTTDFSTINNMQQPRELELVINKRIIKGR